MSKPCVGCGWCCISDPCMESHRRHGYLPRCPELLWNELSGRYVCLLMDDPERGHSAREALNEGQGCCAPLNVWRDDVRNRDVD